MPITEFQRAILKLLAKNRSSHSHIGGGIAINSSPESLRYSHDIDIFHEAELEVNKASLADIAVLETHGYTVKKLRGDWEKPSSFRKAQVVQGGDSIEIDWVIDTAWRFFPTVECPIMGHKLHWFDTAINKSLALASRSVSRDYIDIVEICNRVPLAAICWAACAKDTGYSPLLLLEMMKRFAKVSPEEVKEIQAHSIDVTILKKRWIELQLEAENQLNLMANSSPQTPIGIAFLDENNNPTWNINDPSLRQLPISLRGCIAQISH